MTMCLAALYLGLSGPFFLRGSKHLERTGKAVFATLMFSALTLSCGGSGSSKAPATPKGTSVITITASEGATTHTTTVTLNVQ